MDKDLKRAKMLISLVHDGRLTDEEYRFLEKAIARYPELKLDIYRHERLHDLMKMVGGASAPLSLEERVLESIKSEGPVARTARIVFFPGRRFTARAGAFAAAAVIILAVIISFPSVVGIDRAGKEIAVLPNLKAVSPTASVALGKMPASEPRKETLPAEDVALVAGAAGDRETSRFSPPKTDEQSPPAPETNRKSLSAGLSAPGVMTATGVTAEKVSKVLSPARDALLSSAKKESSIVTGSTTYIYCPSSEAELPTILLIYRNDPAAIKKDIMDKAVSLGGSVTTGSIEEVKGKEEKDLKDKDAASPYADFFSKESVGDAVSLTPDKMNELLDFLAARYPETEKEVRDLKTRKTVPFLRIDVVPTVQ